MRTKVLAHATCGRLQLAHDAFMRSTHSLPRPPPAQVRIAADNEMSVSGTAGFRSVARASRLRRIFWKGLACGTLAGAALVALAAWATKPAGKGGSHRVAAVLQG